MFIYAVNLYAPYKTNMIRNDPCPWLNGDIFRLMHARDAYHRHAMKTNSSVLLNRYKQLRNLVTRELKSAKDRYLHDSLHANSGKVGAIWSTLKMLTKSKSQNSLSLTDNDDNEISDSRSVAEEFNDYFADAVQCLIQENGTDQTENHENESTFTVHSSVSDSGVFELPLVTSQFVESEIRTLDTKKATGPDDISCLLFKVVADVPVLLESLTYILSIHV